MKVKTIGIDVAKNVFQVHGVDEDGKVVLRKQLRRSQVMEFFAQRPPCLVGIEACGSAHHWARRLMKIGYTVKLMAPQFVKPYVKTNKNDAADAEAICEAVSRPTMRFVPVKTVDQQAALSVHRARQGFVQQRTAQANQIRGLLAEYGVVIPQGIGNIRKCLPEILEDAENSLPCLFRQLLGQLGEHLKELDQLVKEMDHQIQQWHGNNEASQRLAAIAGMGPITASAMVGSVGDARNFRNGRQLAAWLGLVPRQHSTGGKSLLLGISKRGDCYLRTLLIHGARSVIRCSGRKAVVDPGDKMTWLQSLVLRRGANVAAVALANKNARVIWALLAHDRHYQRSVACSA
ncbi:MAG: IS110 family transposase [Acidobacteriaceae bacterium]